jgi:hypothetical protein
MLGNFERGQVVDLEIIFVSTLDNQLFDPVNPTFEISHYDGANEIIDVPETPLIKVSTRPLGFYTYPFVIPADYLLDTTYFVRWRGENPDPACNCGREVYEDSFRVSTINSGGGSSNNCCCLVPRFTSC